MAARKNKYVSNCRIETVVEDKKVVIKAGTELTMTAKEAVEFGGTIDLVKGSEEESSDSEGE